jgi:hypothetical protein
VGRPSSIDPELMMRMLIVVAAIVREMAAFLWAIGREVAPA